MKWTCYRKTQNTKNKEKKNNFQLQIENVRNDFPFRWKFISINMGIEFGEGWNVDGIAMKRNEMDKTIKRTNEKIILIWMGKQYAECRMPTQAECPEK